MLRRKSGAKNSAFS